MSNELAIPAAVLPPSDVELQARAAYRLPTDAEVAARVERLNREGAELRRISNQEGV